MTDEKRFKMTQIQLLKLVLCMLAFGLLMALRAEVDGLWLRTVVAGCAGAALGLGLMWSRKK